MIKIVRCLLISIMCFSGTLFAENGLRKTVAVIPFETINISASDADRLGRKMVEAFMSVPEIDVVSYEKAVLGFKNTSIVKDSLCRNRVCLMAVAKSLNVNVAFIGSFYKIDNKIVLSVSAVVPDKNETLWAKDYSSDGDSNDFIKKTSENVVIDARNAFLVEAKLPEQDQNQIIEEKRDTSSDTTIITIEKPSDSDIVKATEVTVVTVNDDENVKNSDDKEIRNASNYSTVTSFTAGAVGRYVINEPGKTESPWGYDIFCLFPTTPNGQVRIKFALPMATADTMLKNTTYIKNKDYLFTLEHEWGFKKFGVTLGAGYMYLDNFAKRKRDSTSSYIANNSYEFQSVNRANWVFGIRAGKPNKGFKGRISYPMTFGSEDDVFIEYSAFGMFGGEKVKAGIGFQGSAKRRTAKLSQSVIVYSNSSFYKSSIDSTISLTEYYFMGPSGKVAFAVGSHSVVTLGLDFMGVLVPDLFNFNGSWTPNILLGYTFSFGKIPSVETYDGKF